MIFTMNTLMEMITRRLELVSISDKPKIDVLAKDRREADDARDETMLCLAKYRPNYYGNSAQPYDVIRLSIRGEREVVVLRSALTWVKGSMLAAKFSGRWDQCNEKDEDAFRIDIDDALFFHVIQILLTKRVKYPFKVAGLDEEMKSDFEDVLDYYGLKEITDPMRLKFVNHQNEYVKSNIRGLVAKTDICQRWAVSHELIYDGMERSTKSLEIKFAKPFHHFVGIQLSQIVVWIGKNTCGFRTITIQYNGTVSKEAMLHLDYYDIHPDHLLVRFEDYGRRWFINDKPLESSFQKVIDSIFRDHPLATRQSFAPVIGHFGGEFEITSYECTF